MFLDTSGLLCFLDGREPEHESAATLFGAASRRLTHNYVLAELVALCEARNVERSRALAFVAALCRAEAAEIIRVDEQMHRAALSLLLSRPDKRWSLCDAVSFVLMEREGVTDALTTDHHFEQAGLRPLLT